MKKNSKCRVQKMSDPLLENVSAIQKKYQHFKNVYALKNCVRDVLTKMLYNVTTRSAAPLRRATSRHYAEQPAAPSGYTGARRCHPPSGGWAAASRIQRPRAADATPAARAGPCDAADISPLSAHVVACRLDLRSRVVAEGHDKVCRAPPLPQGRGEAHGDDAYVVLRGWCHRLNTCTCREEPLPPWLRCGIDSPERRSCLTHHALPGHISPTAISTPYMCDVLFAVEIDVVRRGAVVVQGPSRHVRDGLSLSAERKVHKHTTKAKWCQINSGFLI